MNILNMVIRELIFRKSHFVLALLSVTAAVATLIGTLTLLEVEKDHTAILLADSQKAVEMAGAALQDSMRKITKGLGFNIIILPKDQDLNEMNLEGSLSKTMSESYVDRLAESNIVTINHLLPTVMKKIVWPEKHIEVVVYGTRGEVPILHRDPKKPLLDTVQRGSMIMGFEIARKLSLDAGDTVRLLETEFIILKTHTQRGSIDDSTVWINLAQAQELFGMKNLVHAIQALECHCAGDRITAIRKEIEGILPGTQVIERGQSALARAESRLTAKETAEAALKQEKRSRGVLRREREQLASILLPMVLLASTLWIGVLAMGNVRERRNEIGILHALGYEFNQILGLFLGKAILIACVGACMGYGLGVFAGTGLGANQLSGQGVATYVNLIHFMIALGLALFLSIAGSWIPALLAARQDPAKILQNE